MHGDVDGQQLDQGALGIILVSQGELPNLVVVMMFGRLGQGWSPEIQVFSMPRRSTL